MFLAEILHEKAQPISEIVLKVARVDVEHLVKGSGDVESGGIAVGKFFARSKLLKCKPLLIGKCVLHLVAVFPDVVRAYYRSYLGGFHLGDSFDGILYLLLLAFQLKRVGKVLPAATSAQREMLASRLYSHLAGGVHLCDVTFGVAFLLFVYLDINYVAGGTVGNEYHHLVDTSYRVAFSCNIFYGYLLQYRELFAFP